MLCEVFAWLWITLWNLRGSLVAKDMFQFKFITFAGFEYLAEVVAKLVETELPFMMKRYIRFLMLLQLSAVKGKGMDVNNSFSVGEAKLLLNTLERVSGGRNLVLDTKTEGMQHIITLQPERVLSKEERRQNWLTYNAVEFSEWRGMLHAHMHFRKEGKGVKKISHYREDVAAKYFGSFGPKGIIAQAKQCLQYDRKVVEANREGIIAETMKSLEEGKIPGMSKTQLSLSRAELAELINWSLDWMLKGHQAGRMSLDLRGRFYMLAATIVTIQSSKLLRACLSCPRNCSWDQIEEAVIWSWGELTGNTKCRKGNPLTWTWKKAFNQAKREWNKALKAHKAEVPVTKDHEKLWAWRLEDNYINFNGVWSVPVELDQHASFASYYGALFGILALLINTNTVTNEKGLKLDYYHEASVEVRTRSGKTLQQVFDEICPKALQRVLRKALGTPAAFGSNVNSYGYEPKSFALLRINRDVKKLVKGDMEGWLKANVKAINACWAIVKAETPTRIAEAIVAMALPTCRLSNGEMILKMDNRGDVILAQTNHFLREEVVTQNERYWQDKTVYTKGQYLRRVVDGKDGVKFKWVIGNEKINIPTYYMPDTDRFARYMPTAEIHHQDAVTANYVSWRIINEGGFCVTIHDAFIVHPLDAAKVKTLVQERMWEVYSRRNELLEAFCSNFGWDADKLRSLIPGAESAGSLTHEDFINGHCVK